MKVTGTKCYVQIEDDAGNIARFDGEVCFGEFCALADSIEWAGTAVRRLSRTGLT